LCVIVDASVAGLVFPVPHKADFVPLWGWIEKSAGKLVYGGRVTDELLRLPNVRRRLAEMKRSGRALECSRQDVDKQEKAVRKTRLCRSNDFHVIALAQVSGARILCAEDHDLETDFKNPQLLPTPWRGQIYKKARDQNLLKHNGICIGRPKK
jgi:hypothetical protein